MRFEQKVQSIAVVVVIFLTNLKKNNQDGQWQTIKMGKRGREECAVYAKQVESSRLVLLCIQQSIESNASLLVSLSVGQVLVCVCSFITLVVVNL